MTQDIIEYPFKNWRCLHDEHTSYSWNGLQAKCNDCRMMSPIFGDKEIKSKQYTVVPKPKEPTYCELWEDAKGKKWLVLANCLKGDSIWSMEPDSCEMGFMIVSGAKKIGQEDFQTILDKLETNSMTGCSDSMWWCAWAYEGNNHPRSVWYYIASLRSNPKKHAWAFGRIHSDAYSSAVCKGVPKPCLNFLANIPEFQTIKLGRTDWLQAVQMAKSSEHKALME